MGVILTSGRTPLVTVGRAPLVTGAIAPDPPLPPPSAYKYPPPHLPATADKLIVFNAPANGATISIPDPNDPTKYVLVVSPPEPMSGRVTTRQAGGNNDGITAAGVFFIGAQFDQIGWSTAQQPNLTVRKGGDIMECRFKAYNAPKRPFFWLSRIGYNPVDSFWGDLLKFGTVITGTTLNYNWAQHAIYMLQKIHLTNGHFGWTAPDKGTNTHSDLAQSSLGSYHKLIIAECDTSWSGNNWYTLPSGNMDNAASGKTMADKESEIILDTISMRYCNETPGFNNIPAQYLLWSGSRNGKDGFTTVVNGTTGLLEGRYPSLLTKDVVVLRHPNELNLGDYFGGPSLQKQVVGQEVRFSAYNPGLAARPNGQNLTRGPDGYGKFTFVNDIAQLPLRCNAAEYGFERRVRNFDELMAEFGL